MTEDKGKAVGIREGWNGGKRLAARCSSEVKDWGQLILRAVEILAGLLVHVNTLFTNPDFPQGNHLPILILFFGGNADVTISRRFDTTSHPFASATRCHAPVRLPVPPPRRSGANRA